MKGLRAMPKTILDYIIDAKVRARDPRLVAQYIELVHWLAVRSAESFVKLYELIEKSNDKKLKREAQKLFGKTVVEIAATLNEIGRIEKQLFKQGEKQRKMER